MLLRLPQVVAGLHVHPHLGTGVQCNGKPHRHLGTDPGVFVDQLGKAPYGKHRDAWLPG